MNKIMIALENTTNILIKRKKDFIFTVFGVKLY